MAGGIRIVFGVVSLLLGEYFFFTAEGSYLDLAFAALGIVLLGWGLWSKDIVPPTRTKLPRIQGAIIFAPSLAALEGPNSR